MQEETLPEPLQKLQKEYPGVHIAEAPTPVVYEASGTAFSLERGASLLYVLGQLLWCDGRKFRVTVECNPETGRFQAQRENLD